MNSITFYAGRNTLPPRQSCRRGRPDYTMEEFVNHSLVFLSMLVGLGRSLLSDWVRLLLVSSWILAQSAHHWILAPYLP